MESGERAFAAVGLTQRFSRVGNNPLQRGCAEDERLQGAKKMEALAEVVYILSNSVRARPPCP